jgi:micrococcal nuclease
VEVPPIDIHADRQGSPRAVPHHGEVRPIVASRIPKANSKFIELNEFWNRTCRPGRYPRELSTLESGLESAYPSGMKRFITALVLILNPAWSPAADDYPARVVGISDGDTLTVLKADKTQAKIRLNGIDAPESGQDFGSRAKQAASELSFGKEVTIHPTDTDRYGRTVADVILPDGKSLNRELVGRGMAWWYRQYAPADKELERLETEAKAAKRGLWAQPSPVPPWEFRKGKGVPVTAEVVGNRNSHVYHAPNCPSVGRMKEANKMTFKTAAEAVQTGYRKAADCK